MTKRFLIGILKHILILLKAVLLETDYILMKSIKQKANF